MGVPKESTIISSLYLPQPKKEMNVKFDSTQFKFSLPGETASLLQDYKIKQTGKIMLFFLQENEKLNIQLIGTSSQKLHNTVLPCPEMIRYNQETFKLKV